MLIDYLKENIDDLARIERLDISVLPIYLRNEYKYQKLELLEHSYLLMTPVSNDFGLQTVMQHMKVLTDRLSLKIVLNLETISAYMRKQMIFKRIPFIMDNNQIYLPFIYIDFTKIKDLSEINQFSPIDQITFLYFLYHPEARINVTQLARKIGYTEMSISRSLKYLYSVRLLDYDIEGKTNRAKVYFCSQPDTYYARAKKYLINPVFMKFYIHKENRVDSMIVSNVDALSTQSRIIPLKQSHYAISKSEYSQLKTFSVDSHEAKNNPEYVCLEVYKYDPALFAKDKIVDPLSMLLSLSQRDERIDESIIEFMEGEKWFQG